MKSEDEPLDPNPPGDLAPLLDAIRHLESAVTGATDLEGIVLRYGFFYGPGTAIAPDGGTGVEVLRRRFPVVGRGGGVWSFIHIDDVADATVAALERGKPGIYNVVDDEPATVAEWLPELADGARRRPAAAGAGVGGPARRRGRRPVDDDRGARRIQRQGQARARLAAASSELARGVPHRARLSRSCEDSAPMDGGDGPRFGAMIGLVAVVVATVILVFFGIGYALGRLFL